jgi:hypothetical protein
MAATEKMVSDATASFGKHYGRVRRLNGLNDPMTRHDISSKLRSGLKCLPDLISIDMQKERAVRNQASSWTLPVGQESVSACLEFIERKFTKFTRCHVLMSATT